MFSSVQRPDRHLPPHIQWVSGNLYPGLKRPGREADHSPPTSAEIKITWSYVSTPPYIFMAYCLITGINVPYHYYCYIRFLLRT
jgi:hypothetical protein